MLTATESIKLEFGNHYTPHRLKNTHPVLVQLYKQRIAQINMVRPESLTIHEYNPLEYSILNHPDTIEMGVKAYHVDPYQDWEGIVLFPEQLIMASRIWTVNLESLSVAENRVFGIRDRQSARILSELDVTRHEKESDLDSEWLVITNGVVHGLHRVTGVGCRSIGTPCVSFMNRHLADHYLHCAEKQNRIEESYHGNDPRLLHWDRRFL